MNRVLHRCSEFCLILALAYSVFGFVAFWYRDCTQVTVKTELAAGSEVLATYSTHGYYCKK